MSTPKLTLPRRLKKLAQELLGKPDKLKEVLDLAENSGQAAKGKLSSVFEDFKTMIRLLRAWRQKAYVEVPKRTLLRMLFSLLYFLLIVDGIPDFIPGIGLLDDLTVIGWVLKGVRQDLEDFLSWERRQNSQED